MYTRDGTHGKSAAMDSTHTLIVGGGVTGLAYANATTRDWLLVERERELGGYCRTVLQDGFVWDYSGHFFHFRHPGIERFLRDRMPVGQVETIRKSAGILYGGRRIDFPFQKNIHQLALPDFLACLHDLYFRDTARPVTSFLDMLYARFGRAISEKFLIPYNEKLYACSLDTLDVDAMGRFFPHADIADIIRNFVAPDNASYNATFTYPRGGAIEYIRALERDLDPGRIATDETLLAIDGHVATTTRRQIRFEHLVSSLPFDKLLGACGQPVEPGVYTYNKVLVFNLGFDKKGWETDHWLYVPDKSVSFYRVGFYDNIFGTDRMSLYIEIGLAMDAGPVDIEAWRQRVLTDLARIGLVTDHRLVSWHSVVLDPAYVHITERSRADFQVKAAALRERDVHSLGRYGGWTYCAIEDNIVEARALAATLG